jgi:hypothetical protein
MGSLEARIVEEWREPHDLLSYLRKAQPDERYLDLKVRQRAAGPVYIRSWVLPVPGTDPQDQFSVTVVHSGFECTVRFTPFIRPPTPAEIDYAIAFCDTLSKTR